MRTKDGTLEIRWPESVEQHGGSRVSRFLVSELLNTAANARPLEDSRVAWGARLFSQEGHPTVAAAELRFEEGLRGALLRLRDYGVLRLREMPSSSRETRELVEVPRHATPRHATPRHTLPHTATLHGRARGAHLDDDGAAHRRGAADLLRRDVVDPRRGGTDGGRERHGLLQRGHPAAHRRNLLPRPTRPAGALRARPRFPSCTPNRALVRSRIAGSRSLAFAH